MNKYYLKANDKEVKLGDIVRVRKEIETELGHVAFTAHLTLTEKTLPILIKDGIITVKEEVSLDKEFCIKQFAKRNKLDIAEASKLISKIIGNNPSSALKILLKELSLYFNSEEELRILPKVFAISVLDGSVYPINTKDIKSKEIPFAAFASKNKAKKAKGVLFDLFVRLYGEQIVGYGESEDKKCKS